MLFLHSRRIDKSGFTLIEVVVSLLIMGISVSGLLNLFQWGQQRYSALTKSWRTRTAVGDFQRFLRQQICSGDIASLSIGLIEKEATFLKSNLRLTSFTVKPYTNGGVFVSAGLYEDFDKNGKVNRGEELPPVLWCFRVRTNQ